MKEILRKLLVSLLLPFFRNFVVELVTRITDKFVLAIEDGKFTKEELEGIKQELIDVIQDNLKNLV